MQHFSGVKYLTHKDAHFGLDPDQKPYVHLNLPSAKTAKPGKIQFVFLVPEDGLCPLKSLQNLARVVPAGLMTLYSCGIISMETSAPWLKLKPSPILIPSLKLRVGTLPLATLSALVMNHFTCPRK
jgi:hypothetical protein